MSDPAGELYKAKFAVAAILNEATDIYRVLDAAVGFQRDEYGNKSYRWADSLLSLRDCLTSTGRDLRTYIRLPEGEPQASPQVQPQPAPPAPEARQQPSSGRDAVTVGDAVVTLQRYCRHLLDGGRHRDAALRLLDALSSSALRE